MQLSVLIYVCCISVWVDLAAGNCNITGEDGTKYTKRYLAKDLNDPRGLVVDWKNNKLYFNIFIGIRTSAVMDLATEVLNNIPELTDIWCWFTINRGRGNIYAGCKKYDGSSGGGLFAFDSNLMQFVLIGAEGQNIDYAHYSDALYFSNYDSGSLQVFENYELRVIPELVDQRVLQMVVDGAGDWLYFTNTEVCRLKAHTRTRVWCMDNKAPIKLVVGPTGDVYMCHPSDGILRFDSGVAATPRLVVPVPCRGLAFDVRGNIIYAETYAIARLDKC